MLSNIVLSDELEVFKLGNNGNHIEMHWQKDRNQTGKRKYGNLYISGGYKQTGFKTNVMPVFLSELGILMG